MNLKMGGELILNPPTFYLALHTAMPKFDRSGTEVSGGNYARAEVRSDLSANASRQLDEVAAFLGKDD